jgi:protein-S-isoprenylcysteine O-methyltransferase Ste14
MWWTPDIEFGIWNAWIFMIWQIILPMSSTYVIREKMVVKQLRASVPMKYEKISNILSFVLLVIAFIYSIFLPLQFDTLLFYIGLFIFLFGLMIELMTLYTFRGAKPERPFTTGPYRYSRHPVYFGFLLIYLSISLMSLSWVFFIITILNIIHLVFVIPSEERYCLEKYGMEYKKYIERTPRWIGFPASSVK